MGTYTQEERDKMPASAFCGPSRTFPILDQDDVDKAVPRLNTTDHATGPIRACIVGKAKAHGWGYPDAWKDAEHSAGAACPSGVAFDAGEYVVRRGLIFRAGNYEDKDFRADPEDLWAATLGFTAVPVDLEHTPTVLESKLGTLEKIELSPDGHALYGDVRLPKWLDDLLEAGERKVSCTWDRATKRLTGLALVRNPRISDAALMAAFAGQRHSAADQADMQQIHDIAARQGAACRDANVDESERNPMATNDQDLNAQIGLFGKFMRWMGNEQPQEAPAATAAFSAPSVTPTPAPAAAQPDPEKEALRAQLAQLRAQQIADRAAAFATEQIAANKALPAQRDAIVAAYSVAAADDAEHGQATFGAGKTSRVDALAALFTNAPTHALTQQMVPVTAGETVFGNLGRTATADDETRPMDPKHLARLLGMTPEGKAALRDMASAK